MVDADCWGWDFGLFEAKNMALDVSSVKNFIAHSALILKEECRAYHRNGWAEVLLLYRFTNTFLYKARMLSVHSGRVPTRTKVTQEIRRPDSMYYLQYIYIILYIY